MNNLSVVWQSLTYLALIRIYSWRKWSWWSIQKLMTSLLPHPTACSPTYIHIIYYTVQLLELFGKLFTLISSLLLVKQQLAPLAPHLFPANCSKFCVSVCFFQVTDRFWRESLMFSPRDISDALCRFRLIIKTIHTHVLMKTSAPQPPTYSPAWSNCSFTELMRKWARMKESFGCCIPSRNAISFSAASDYITSKARHGRFCEGSHLKQ